MIFCWIEAFKAQKKSLQSSHSTKKEKKGETGTIPWWNKNMNIQVLNPNEYEDFLAKSKTAYNFMQSAAFARSLEKSDKVQILAGVENGEILYAVIVILRPAMKLFSYASSPREWVVARPELLQDESKLKEFVQGVQKKLKDEKAIVWLVESNVELQPHDQNGHVVEGFFNESYRDFLARVGFEKGPLWKGYDEGRQSRWVSWIDLQKNLPQIYQGYPAPLESGLEEYTWPELLKEMAGNTRRSFQKTDLPYLVCERHDGTEEVDLSEFDALLESSAEKHHFGTGNSNHRLDLLKAFGKNGYLCTSYLDVEAYETYLQERHAEFTKQEAEALAVCERMPRSKKKRNQLLEIQEQKNHNEKELVALAELKTKETQKRIPLASGLFFETPSEMVYLFGGSRPDLARYFGPYAMQKMMIRLALEHGLQRYNFWGISGNFEPEQEGYGVFFFKKNLGATVGEYCGEFYLPIQGWLSKLFLNKIRPDHQK